MSLNGSDLGTAIKNKLVADGAAIDDAQTAAVWDSIGNAVIDYLVANAVVDAGIVLTTPDTINGSTTGTGSIS